MRVLFLLFFFLMTRRPPRSTPLSLHDALPIWEIAAMMCSEDVSKICCVASRRSPSKWNSSIQYAAFARKNSRTGRSEEHTSELQSRQYLVCRLLLEKKKTKKNTDLIYD